MFRVFFNQFTSHQFTNLHIYEFQGIFFLKFRAQFIFDNSIRNQANINHLTELLYFYCKSRGDLNLWYKMVQGNFP